MYFLTVLESRTSKIKALVSLNFWWRTFYWLADCCFMHILSFSSEWGGCVGGRQGERERKRGREREKRKQVSRLKLLCIISLNLRQTCNTTVMQAARIMFCYLKNHGNQVRIKHYKLLVNILNYPLLCRSLRRGIRKT